jgi:nucleotidyltransferase-like protein
MIKFADILSISDPQRSCPVAIPAEVEALALFGSRSRGDADSESDTDVVVFAHVASSDDLVVVKQKMMTLFPSMSFSVYSTATGQTMAEDGSLFLWHLKLEAKVLFNRSAWFETVLSGLRPYSLAKVQRDLDTFDLVLRDVTDNIGSGSVILLYEASTLFSILRSIGMIATLVAGTPNFGRREPIEFVRLLARGKITLDSADLDDLTSARHVYARNIVRRVGLSSTRLAQWAQQISIASQVVREYAHSLLQ